MDDILLRPIFRSKYVAEQKSKNKFNQGGLANLQKFSEGGLTRGERTAMTLAPFVQALTGAQTRPGESQMSGVARAFGQGMGGLGEAKKNIAVIDQANTPKATGAFTILTEEQRIARKLPQGTWQRDLTTGKMENIEKRQLFADPFDVKMAGNAAEEVKNVRTDYAAALGNKDTLNIIQTILKNPDLKMGQFGKISESAGRFLEGIGFDTNTITDITGAQVLQKIAGQKVLGDLGQLKGALSEKELAFIQGLNTSVADSKEGAILANEMFIRANERAIKLGEIYDSHVSKFGSPLKPDDQGKTIAQKRAELFQAYPIYTPDIAARLRGSLSKGKQSKYARDTIVITKEQAEAERKLNRGSTAQAGTYERRTLADGTVKIVKVK